MHHDALHLQSINLVLTGLLLYIIVLYCYYSQLSGMDTVVNLGASGCILVRCRASWGEPERSELTELKAIMTKAVFVKLC